MLTEVLNCCWNYWNTLDIRTLMGPRSWPSWGVLQYLVRNRTVISGWSIPVWHLSPFGIVGHLLVWGCEFRWDKTQSLGSLHIQLELILRTVLMHLQRLIQYIYFTITSRVGSTLEKGNLRKSYTLGNSIQFTTLELREGEATHKIK